MPYFCIPLCCYKVWNHHRLTKVSSTHIPGIHTHTATGWLPTLLSLSHTRTMYMVAHRVSTHKRATTCSTSHRARTHPTPRQIACHRCQVPPSCWHADMFHCLPLENNGTIYTHAYAQLVIANVRAWHFDGRVFWKWASGRIQRMAEEIGMERKT